MKNLINYLYKIEITDIIKEDNYYLIKEMGNTYLFSEINNMGNFMYIYNICNILNQSMFFSYKVKTNIYNDFITEIEGKKYYLLYLNNDYKCEVDFLDMLNFYDKSSNFLKNNFKYQLNWDVLWESKIDYLTKHIENNKISNKRLLILLYYYLGVSENALLYIKEIKSNYTFSINDKVSFTHRRVVLPCKKIFFYNPQNFIIDLEVRDIAEYIKSLYYNDLDYLNDLEYYLKVSNLTKYSASLLYVRIVYPSLFFDYYESKSDIFYFEKFYNIGEYESFIKKTYELINSYVNIEKISWL